MAKKRRRPYPGPRSRHGDGSGWNWKIFPDTPKRARGTSSGSNPLKGVFTSLTWFLGGGSKVTMRKKGHQHIARIHPHRYRRRERPHRERHKGWWG